jgi:hypothetical protein
MDVDGIGSFAVVAVAVAVAVVVTAPGFCMVSVTAFIILYGLLLLPRIDLGKYWSSMEGVYSGGCAGVGAGVGVGAVVGAVALLNISLSFTCFSSVSLRVFNV